MDSNIATEVQKLEPDALIVLYELDGTSIGTGILRFHGMFGESIFFKGQEYSPWPVTAEGFERTTSQQPTPTVTFGNVDGSISTLCQLYEDFLGAKFTRRRTFARYLDGMPDANVNAEFVPEVYYVDRKSQEDRTQVQFELVSVLDFQGKQLPGRQIIPNQCTWAYRGEGCAYAGIAVAQADGTPTSDPALDRCGKRLSDCKLRQWPDGVLNFGGFPAAGLVRT